jgi:hypothetical protein
MDRFVVKSGRSIANNGADNSEEITPTDMAVELTASFSSPNSSTTGINYSKVPTDNDSATTTSSTSSSTSDTTNPWPFIEKYFIVTGVTWHNVEFKCITCAPKLKLLSVNKKSLYNLELHINRVYPSLSNEVTRCIAVGIKERKRERERSTDSETDA